MKTKEQVLLEEAYDLVRLVLENKKQAQQLVDKGKLSVKDFEQILAVDTTPTKKYVGWMANQWVLKNVNDLNELKAVVTKLDRLISKNSKNLKPEYKDFLNKTFDQIKDGVNQAEKKDIRNPSLKVKSKDYTTLLDDDDLLIVLPHSFEAAKKLGKGAFSYRECKGGEKDSAWCITHNIDYWSEHEDGVFYFVKIKSQKMLKALAKAGYSKEYSVMALKLRKINNKIEITGTDAMNDHYEEYLEEQLEKYFGVVKIKPLIVDHFNKNYKNKKPKEATIKKWLKTIDDYVKGKSETNHLSLNRCPLEEIPPTLKRVEGWLDLQNTTFLKKLPDNLTVEGDILLSNTSLTTLPNNLSLDNLYLGDASISNFPSDLKIKGSIYFGKENPLYGKKTQKELKAMYPNFNFIKY